MNQIEKRNFEDTFCNALNLFNDQKWYEAHDAFEDIWNTLDGDERQIIQGILQVAVSQFHLSKGNLNGATILLGEGCLLYTSPSPRDRTRSRMPSSA